MSIMQRLTLIGFYNYDATLFDGLKLPEGYDKQTFIDSLLLEHGEKLVLYSNPDFMKQSIELWGRKWSLELARIYEALTAEYNPIHNYDRYEEYEDEEGRTYKSVNTSGHKATDTPNYSDTQTNNNTDKTTNDFEVVTETNTNATTEHLISADNSSDYQPSSKDITDGGKNTVSNDGTITDLHTGTIKHDITGTTQNLDETANSNTDDTENKKFKHSAHLYGNIGVTESTTMIQNTVNMRRNYNLYEAATRLFANELLIAIY